jgi:two-component system chemotaxis sensor kinase CheA
VTRQSSDPTAKRSARRASRPPAPPGPALELPLEKGEESLMNLADAVAAPAPEGAPAPAALNQDPQLVADFLVESREHLANIEARLLELEQGAAAPETLHGAFRSFHTIKGLAGFLDYALIQEVAHEVETVLDKARNGELVLGPTAVDAALGASDYLSLWLKHIEQMQRGTAVEAPARPEALMARLRAVAEGGAADPAGPRADLPGPETQPAPGPDRPGGRQPESSLLKVDTAKLEYLVDMVGELVIAQSLLRHNPDLAAVKAPRLQRDLAQLSRVTAEVQKTAMAMRMVQIGTLFRRMTRLVRDLAKKSGKLAELEMSGEDVELDRTIVEELSDPMVHMLRNSIDHGLESPDEREAAGKPRCGRILLKAQHQAGMIVVEVIDDGRGLNRAKIAERAIARGLISPAQTLTSGEIDSLIFQPGFSTADKVSGVSGRGVGMDVVRKHVEKLRGRIEISSTPGQGTRFLLKLPLTLAIIDGLVVVAGGERFIVPLFSVREMFRPPAEALFTVEGKGELLLVRDRLLPLLRLNRRLGLRAGVEDPCAGVVIVGENEGRQFCILVDELAGKQEVVIKSLGSMFARVRGIAGGAILGDGRIGLILDMATVAGAGAATGAGEPSAAGH